MDTISHALWGKGFFGYRGKPYWSLFFGALPDLFSFGLYTIITLLLNPEGMQYGKPEFTNDHYIHTLYGCTHSLFIATICVVIVYMFLNKNFAFAMLAWPLHILIDIPTHTIDYFPTPILFPLGEIWTILDIKFNGVSWGKPYVFIPNVAGLIILYIYRFYIRKDNKKNNAI